MKTFTTKLGATRAGARSRIWIEGDRLADVGFTPGVKFEKDFEPLKRTLWLYAITDKQFAECPHKLRGTVSGKGTKPIIDIVGAKVIECFSTSHVSVTYEAGLITITEAVQS